MSVPTGSLAVAPRRLEAVERALPRADQVLSAPARRRERWRGGRRWPFGPIPTAISLVLHAAALVAIVWALAAPPPPEGIGEHVLVAMTPDLGDFDDYSVIDAPDEIPSLEVLEIPLPALEREPDLEMEPELEELAELAVQPLESGLTLDVVSKRLPAKVPARTETPPVPTPPVRITSPAPRPPPRAVPRPRARGAMPRGRLRPILTPITYPDAARRAGIEGRARVQMTIDANGTVFDVILLASSGHQVLDQAALASARRWRFVPPGSVRRAAQTFRFAMD